jgi:pimeloyl-ACP methyl ester carboxylesterase
MIFLAGRSNWWPFFLVILFSMSGCQTVRGWLGKDSGESSIPAISHFERNLNKDRVIVFVHGIFGNATDTWACARGGPYWPKMLLSDKTYDDSDVYVVSYATPYLGNRMTIDEVVGNLANRLEHDGVFQHREVVFVAHSLGGLIVQRFLLTHRELAPQVRFIYFFSTPETGAEIAKLGRIFSADPLLKEMFPGDDNDYLLNLEQEWKSAHFENIHRYCAYEKKKLAGVLVVDRLSGTRNCESGVAINENHAGIVKPCSADDDSYIALQNAIRNNPIAARPIATKVETVTRNWSSYQEVGCNQTNRQTLTASVALDPSVKERVTAATGALLSPDKIQGASPVGVTMTSANTANVTFSFNGLDAGVLGCPGGGHATVVVSFTIERTVPVN